MTDMTDKARAWIKYQKALTPDTPSFVYFAPGATHAPHHVPKDWIARWKGKFDQGWDKVREETLARQIQMGVVPAGTKLAPKPPDIKDWDTLSADEKRLFTRQAEVFAAFVEYTDFEIGRMLDAFAEVGQADNTLVFYIAGDNGTSGEGGMSGMFNEYTYFNGVQEKTEDMLKHLDQWGGPETYPHMAAGWAVAFDSPFGWMKQVPSDFGGTRNGMVVSWPKVITAKNEIRTQFGHVIDVAPTILEAIGLPQPTSVNGVPQMPIQGTSLVYSFADAKAKERHTTQYFEVAGNRAIYHDGWYARTIHKAPWEPKPRRTLQDNSAWQLYNVGADFSLADDLAATNEKGRVPDLLPLRHGRMVRSPFTFYRGGPHDGERPRVHPGDGHPRPVLRGRPPLQLRRLRHPGAEGHLLHQRPRRDPAGALGVGRQAPRRELRRGLPGQRLKDSRGRDAAETCVRSYRESMAEFSQMKTLELWYHALAADELVARSGTPRFASGP
jgi:arylsulfatase A-like enzyme